MVRASTPKRKLKIVLSIVQTPPKMERKGRTSHDDEPRQAENSKHVVYIFTKYKKIILNDLIQEDEYFKNTKSLII